MIETSSNLGTYRGSINQLSDTLNSQIFSLNNSIDSVSASLSSSITTLQNNVAATYLPKNAKENTIIQQQWATSNYTTLVNWVSDDTTYLKNKPQIGHHNSGIGGNTGIGTGESGAIVLLPYSTDANPWERGVGLYIGKNALTLDGNEVRYVKTTYSSGNAWYRVWSDGWIEQGNSFSCSTGITSTSTQITFIKAFTRSVNIIGGFVKAANSAAYGQLYFQNGNTTLTGMVCSVICYNSGGSVQHSISGGTGYWYACGY